MANSAARLLAAICLLVSLVFAVELRAAEPGTPVPGSPAYAASVNPSDDVSGDAPALPGAPSLAPIPTFSPEVTTEADGSLVPPPFSGTGIPGLSAAAQETAPFSSNVTDRSITLFVPEPEDGQTSIYYKLLAEFLGKHAKGALRLEYVPGRGGADALNRLAREKGDGSALAGMTLPTFLLQPMMPDKRFEPGAVAPVVLLCGTPAVLWVAENSSIRTLDDLVRGARANPMSSYVAGTGSNTGHHMTTYVLNRAAGISLQYLPYLGSRQAGEAVLKGQALACWGAGTPARFMPGLRPLAIASGIRSPFYPTIPTFSEQGVIIESSDQFGICIPASAPEETRRAASDLFVSVARDPEFQARAGAVGFASSVVPYSGMKEYMEQIRDALRVFLDNYPMAAQQ